MIIDFESLLPSQRYFAMVQAIIPRPIAWVLTRNSNKSYNLAPFSFFTGICSDPPLLMLSIGRKTVGDEKGKEKDTCRNIVEQKEFVVHIASASSVEVLSASAETLIYGDSELDKLGLHTLPFDGFGLPRLALSNLAFGCSLYRLDEIGNAPQAIIYGQIKTMYVSDNIAALNERGQLDIDANKLDPLSRLGGSNYSALGEAFMAKRPQ